MLKELLKNEIPSTNIQGDKSTNTQGNYSRNTQGNWGKNKQGNFSRNTQGDYSINTQGNWTVNTQGNKSTNTQGDDSTNTQGNFSTNIQGDWSTNTQGDFNTNTQGDNSTNIQGDWNTNIQGNFSTNTQGDNCTNMQGDGSKNIQGDNSTNIIYGKDNITKCNGINQVTIFIYNDKNRVYVSEKDYKIGEVIKFKNMEIDKVYTTTPEVIEKLEEDEIVVMEAVQGQMLGFQGKSFNIDMTEGIDGIKYGLSKLLEFANKNATKIIYLTKIGTGIVGYTERQIIELLPDFPANVILPEGWA